MTVFEGFTDLRYFNKVNVLVLIIMYVIFYWFTKSIYQSIILSLSTIFIHYKYLEEHKEELINLNDYTFPKSKYIHDYNNKEFIDFMYLNQEYYYYNKQCWIEMIKCIDRFLEIYEEVKIDHSRAGVLYNSMKDIRDESINSLVSIKINCPDNRIVLDKINNSIITLEQLMNKYLYNVYLINNRDKTGTENELKNRELMTKQLEVLNEYEELLFCRLVLELTTN